jgi:hypothetical protein
VFAAGAVTTSLRNLHSTPQQTFNNVQQCSTILYHSLVELRHWVSAFAPRRIPLQFSVSKSLFMWIRLALCCIVLYSCSSSKQIETRLYFGQSKLDGGVVSEREWNEFVEQYVSRVFPDGSTIQDATGNWYDTTQHRLVTEPSKVIIAINRPSWGLDQKIDSLRYWYKQIHKQQSVLRVDKKVKAKLF